MYYSILLQAFSEINHQKGTSGGCWTQTQSTGHANLFSFWNKSRFVGDRAAIWLELCTWPVKSNEGCKSRSQTRCPQWRAKEWLKFDLDKRGRLCDGCCSILILCLFWQNHPSFSLESTPVEKSLISMRKSFTSVKNHSLRWAKHQRKCGSSRWSPKAFTGQALPFQWISGTICWSLIVTFPYTKETSTKAKRHASAS